MKSLILYILTKGAHCTVEPRESKVNGSEDLMMTLKITTLKNCTFCCNKARQLRGKQIGCINLT